MKGEKDKEIKIWKKLVIVEAIFIGFGGFFIALNFATAIYQKTGFLNYLGILGIGFISIGLATIGIYAKLDKIVAVAVSVNDRLVSINPLSRLRRFSLIWGLGWWIITFLIYAYLLYLTKPYIYYYVSTSMLYHFLLLMFPLFLVLIAKRETFEGIGYKKGINLKPLLVCAFLSFVIPIALLFIKAFSSNKAISMNAQEPFLLLILLYVLYVLVAPFTEELFHRGYLQTEFERRLGINRGLVLASFIFSLIHIPKIVFAPQYVPSPSSPVPILSASAILGLSSLPPLIMVVWWLISFFVMGMIFGIVYQITRSVKYSIIFHVFWNLGSFLFRV